MSTGKAEVSHLSALGKKHWGGDSFGQVLTVATSWEIDTWPNSVAGQVHPSDLRLGLLAFRYRFIDRFRAASRINLSADDLFQSIFLIFFMIDDKSPALDSAVLLAGATAFLYCVSTAYYGGYLGPLNLDADVLDRNFHQALYNGFLVFFSPAFLSLLVYGGVRLLYSHCIFPSVNVWLHHSFSKRKFFLKHRRFWFGERKGSSDEKRHKQRTMILLLYVAVALGIIMSLVYFESLGKKAAVETLKRMNANPLHSPEIVRVKIDDQMRSLFYLVCGARNCAGIDTSTKIVYYFPQNGHSYQYVIRPPSPASSDGAPKAL